jgi:hypothetical protein
VSRPRFRFFDVATCEKLSTLLAIAIENGFAFSFDFLGPYAGVPGRWYIVQLMDMDEKVVVTGRGKDPAEAVSELHERWLAKNMGMA